MTTRSDPAERLTMRQLASELRVGLPTVQRWASDRELPAAKVSKEYRVRRADLEAWIEGKRVAGRDR